MTYGCHNRKPYQPVQAVRVGYIAMNVGPAIGIVPSVETIPFRMSPECNYTHTELGQGDPKCAGCKWRKANH